MYPSALLKKGLVSLALTTLIGLATAAPLGGPLGVNLDLGALGTVKVGPLARDTGKPNTLEKSSPLVLDLGTLLDLEADIGNLKRSTSNPTLEKSSLVNADAKAVLDRILALQADIGVLKRSEPSN